MAVYHLRNFRLGRQTTWGTAVSAGVLLQGVTDGSVTVNVDDEIVEAIGWNVGNLLLTKQRTSEASWTQVATYEQILYILHGLFGAVTPTGSAAPYTWTYTLPRSNAATPTIYSVHYVMQGFDYGLSDCLISRVTLRGEINAALEVEAELISPTAPTVITPATVTTPAVTIINTNDARAFFGPITAVPTTELVGTLISFELNIDSGRHLKHFIGNTRNFGDTQWTIDGTMVLEVNATSRALIESAFQSGTQRMLRMRFDHATDTINTLTIDVPMTVTGGIDLYGDRDGNATVEVSFVGTYSDAITSALRVAVTNSLSSLT